FVVLVRDRIDNCGPGSILHGAGEQEAAAGPDDRRWPAQDGLWDGDPARIIQPDLPGDARDSSINAFGIRQQLRAYLRVRPVSTDQEVSVCGSAVGETRDDRAAGTIHKRLEFPSEADEVIHAIQKNEPQRSAAHRPLRVVGLAIGMRKVDPEQLVELMVEKGERPTRIAGFGDKLAVLRVRQATPERRASGGTDTEAISRLMIGR